MLQTLHYIFIQYSSSKTVQIFSKALRIFFYLYQLFSYLCIEIQWSRWIINGTPGSIKARKFLCTFYGIWKGIWSLYQQLNLKRPFSFQWRMNTNTNTQFIKLSNDDGKFLGYAHKKAMEILYIEGWVYNFVFALSSIYLIRINLH